MPDEGPAGTARRLIAEKEFTFCDSEPTVRGWDARWCAIAPHMASCPGFANGCRDIDASTAERAAAQPRLDKLRAHAGRGAGDRSREAPDPQPSTGVGGLRDALVGAAIALVAWIAWQIWRNRSRKAEPGPAPVAAAELAELELPDPGVLPGVEAALRRAESLAGTQPGPALAWLYAAAMRHLEDRGLLRWRPAMTNRAVVRAVPAGDALGPSLRLLVRTLERWRFGGAPPDVTAARDQVAAVAAILRVALAIAVVGAVGCALPGDGSADGRALAWDLLRAQGFEVKDSLDSLDDVGAESPALWIDAEVGLISSELLAGVRRAVCRGGHVTVFLAGRQSLAPLAPLRTVRGDRRATLSASGPLAITAAGRLPAPLHLSADSAAAGGSGAATTEDGDCDGEDLDPVALLTVGGAPFAVRSDLGEGRLTIVADGDLIANAALAVPANAELLVALAKASAKPDRRIALFVAQQAAAKNPREAMDNAGLWPLVGQGALVLLVLAMVVGRRFGAARDEESFARRDHADHVRALGHQLLRRKASRWPAAAYATWAIERLRQRVGRGARPGDAASLAARLREAQTAVAASVIDDTLREAEELRTNPNGADGPMHLETIHALDRLLYGIDCSPRARRQRRNPP